MEFVGICEYVEEGRCLLPGDMNGKNCKKLETGKCSQFQQMEEKGSSKEWKDWEKHPIDANTETGNKLEKPYKSCTDKCMKKWKCLYFKQACYRNRKKAEVIPEVPSKPQVPVITSKPVPEITNVSRETKSYADRVREYTAAKPSELPIIPIPKIGSSVMEINGKELNQFQILEKIDSQDMEVLVLEDIGKTGNVLGLPMNAFYGKYCYREKAWKKKEIVATGNVFLYTPENGSLLVEKYGKTGRKSKTTIYKF